MFSPFSCSIVNLFGKCSQKRSKKNDGTPTEETRYVDEFTFRLNEGDVKRHTLARLDSFIDAIAGKRLTYKQLTAGVVA